MDFQANRLTRLPSEIGQLRILKSLNLGDNQLISLPSEIGDLHSLQKLFLQGNHLTNLPAEVGQLHDLQELNLSHNQLISLPSKIGGLRNLQKLSLQDNQLTSLPSEIGELSSLQKLFLQDNQLTGLPSEIGELSRLQKLFLQNNQLASIPAEVRKLKNLPSLDLGGNQLNNLPAEVGQLINLQSLNLQKNKLNSLPSEVGKLQNLRSLDLRNNQLKSLPSEIGQLQNLEELVLVGNSLKVEINTAYNQGLKSLLAYLRAKKVSTFEAKLILVGEGGVGKTCLVDALAGKKFVNHKSTHGIRISALTLEDSDSDRKIVLNSWDFGGQRIYRPTHQLFFSSKSLYLVIWKPREGASQGFVEEWIELIKLRVEDEKILVVATHGGPDQRHPNLNQRALYRKFGAESIEGFFSVENKPDKNGVRLGRDELLSELMKQANSLIGQGESTPKVWQDVRDQLTKLNQPYLNFHQVEQVFLSEYRNAHTADGEDEISSEGQQAFIQFLRISHEIGKLIWYEHEDHLKEIVILQPDWLAEAISFVLDDRETKERGGLVSLEQLGEIWKKKSEQSDFNYRQRRIHLIFLELMEIFDLSYKIPNQRNSKNPISLIAQLVPESYPQGRFDRVWPEENPNPDEREKYQICQILNRTSNKPAKAEGIFYLLIVRLHRFSLGKTRFEDSLHWQNGLLLEDGYNGRALIELVAGNDIQVTVRAAYPEYLLRFLTREVKSVVEEGWEGLRCDIMVPCVKPCGMGQAGTSHFSISKLMKRKQSQKSEISCFHPDCEADQDIDTLLGTSPSVYPEAPAWVEEIKQSIASHQEELKATLQGNQDQVLEAVDQLGVDLKTSLSKIDEQYDALFQLHTDDAFHGPRTFSMLPVSHYKLNPKSWMNRTYRVTLWCEHSRLPLPILTGDKEEGVIEIEVTKEWLNKAWPWIKRISTVLSVVLPVALPIAQISLERDDFESIDREFKLGLGIAKGAQALIGAGTEGILKGTESDELEHGRYIRAEGGLLREFHSWLNEKKEFRYGGLIQVHNKQNRILWVHPQFADLEQYRRGRG